MKLCLSALLCFFCMTVPTRAEAPAPFKGGEGGWINVPGGGGGTKPMLVLRGLMAGGSPVFLLSDMKPVPALMVASASSVIEWAAPGAATRLPPPDFLEAKYQTLICGAIVEITVHADCKTRTPAECSKELIKLTQASQREFPPYVPPK